MKRVRPGLAFAVLAATEIAACRGCQRPDDGAAFWWNWWVYATSAFAALLAVLVALFIDKLRAEINAPRLELKIRQARGNPGVQRHDFGTPPRVASLRSPSRWYHLRVWNSNRRVSTVQGVRVLLSEIWEVTDGTPTRIWDEEVPMPWTNYDGSERTIGAHGDADLCMVDGGVHPVPAYGRLPAKNPPGSMPLDIPPNSTRIVVFQARGHEVDSERLCVEIFWNGKFAQDEAQMAEHLKVREASDPSPQSD